MARPAKTKLPSSQLDNNDISLEEIGGVLMDQCSYWHDIPRALISPRRPEGARSKH
jgi:hypothetical protein